jgi:fermentation-respiration switch protein FrsA (DUF1100 family)
MRPMLTVLVVVAVVVGVIWAAQRGLIYFPDADVPPPTAVGLPGAEVVSFDTEDGLHLAGWFVPAIEPTFGHTVIVFNGNAGHRGYRAHLAAQLAARGFATLLFDYRGYGGNPGLPSEEGLARDARAALAYLASRADVDRTRIVYYGESLGSAVAVRLALEYSPAALVLRSPFTSLTDIGRHHYPFLPVGWLLRDRYPSIDRIGGLTSPVLVVVGDEDRIVPASNSEELFDAVPGPKRLVVIEGADHNDMALNAGPELLLAITDWLGGDGSRPSSLVQ